jgi:hypothetical protein
VTVCVLDYVVAAAGSRGIKLVLALGNFWHHYVSRHKCSLRWQHLRLQMPS